MKKTITTLLLSASMILTPVTVSFEAKEPVKQIEDNNNITTFIPYKDLPETRLLAYADIAPDVMETETTEEEVVDVRTYYTTTHPLNVRKTASTYHEPVAWLGKGEPVIGVQTLGNGWVELESGSYVNGKYLEQRDWTDEQYETAREEYSEMVKRLAAEKKAKQEEIARQQAVKKASIDKATTQKITGDQGTSYKSRTGISISSSDRDLLARLVRAEAGGESYEGMVAVASVVFNRMADGRFPNTVNGIVYAKNQFVPAATGSINKAASDIHYKAVDDALQRDNTNGALYFYNAKTAKSRWLDGLQTVSVIGSHTFKVN